MGAGIPEDRNRMALFLARQWERFGDRMRDEAALMEDIGMAVARREEALAATQEAVEIRRALVQANSQAFLPYLAGSLNNLGSDLSDLGRWEEALAAYKEAVRPGPPSSCAFPPPLPIG